MEAILSEQQKQELRQKHRKNKKKKQADRVKTILVLDAGYRYKEIATILLLDESTLRRYFKEYQEGSLDNLLQDAYNKQKKGKLTKEEEKELSEHISNEQYCTAKEVQTHVEKVYGKTYSERGMINLLHRLGFVYKKPKPEPSKANREEQEAFIKTYQKLKEEKGAEDRIWFLDGVHPRHRGMVSYGWIREGEEKEIKGSAGRKGLNINGAYNREDHQVVTREDERINGESTLGLIKQLQKKQPKGKIYLIADNARYNYAKEGREYIKKNQRIEVLYLPPYSPNLNIIERLWKLFKKLVLYNRYYEKYEEFVEATRKFFREVTVKHRSEMESLLTDNFQVMGA